VYRYIQINSLIEFLFVKKLLSVKEVYSASLRAFEADVLPWREKSAMHMRDASLA